jgi:RNA polymerase sigma-70 factor, ECF subfamily
MRRRAARDDRRRTPSAILARVGPFPATVSPGTFMDRVDVTLPDPQHGVASIATTPSDLPRRASEAAARPGRESGWMRVLYSGAAVNARPEPAVDSTRPSTPRTSVPVAGPDAVAVQMQQSTCDQRDGLIPPVADLAAEGTQRVVDSSELDADNVREFQRGIDRQGNFAALMKRRAGNVARCARRQGMLPGSVEDIVQETFEQAYVHLDELREPARFLPWLYAIARHRCNRVRDRERPAAPLDPDEDGDGDDGVASYGEGLAAVTAAVERLPDQERHCFLLVVVEGYKYRQAADLLRLRTGTVKAHVNHAREKLRAMLGSDWHDLF